MKLKVIENSIDPIILERGERYRENGHILSIKEVGPGLYRAEVEGNELYDVEVHLGSRGEVVYTECDCPYDMGAICKHVAAVLLEIRDELSHIETATDPSKSKPSSKVNLTDELSKLSKEDLVALLVHFSEEIKEVDHLLTLKFHDSSSDEGLAQYKKLIQSYVKMNSDRHGFVSYRNVSSAVTGAELVMEKAEEELEKGQRLSAVKISFCILHEMGELLRSCDDSDGIVGGMIQQCLDLVHDVACDLESNSEPDRSAMLQLLLKEAFHTNLEDWSEWQLSLLQSGACLIKNDKERTEWEQQVVKLEEKEKRNSSYGSYIAENVAKLRYQVIQKFDGEEQAMKFLQDHLEFTAFRKMAIVTAMEHQQYDKALLLAEEGERHDTRKGYPGLVDQWKRFRYDIYQLTHQVENQKKLAEEFVVSGEYSYYEQLKELFSKDEWSSVYERILSNLENNQRGNWRVDSLYTQLLIEEKETRRLLNYVNTHKSYVVDFYKHLVGEHAEEVFGLFVQHIVEEAARATNRKAYQKVCQIIRQLIKAKGSVHAEKLIQQFRLVYPNRAAFMDELQKIKS
ncbi:SWIM zinc finger family protein [Paenibacillus alginolyticus]|uniref:SWIM zinc finger family protein n=1 Tax=Paenibacillus alginolyticus TaxID=59839 RepID=A0ABT4G7W6_9BACL|nr:SWIM zinc finger family protein [Paenibacillus alginolyticus]MCY9692280.1 SWIM zinc finger family protein [Paenibacillus alginolyticus]MEC0145879.1 SWIM zinc finger family protein [Paenibacillus alginolyticus]